MPSPQQSTSMPSDLTLSAPAASGFDPTHEPLMALDKLDAVGVSERYLAEGKVNILNHIIKFREQRDHLAYETSQLMLIEQRINEITSNIASNDSRAGNFAEVEDITILDTIRETISNDVSYRLDKLARMGGELADSKPFDPGLDWKKSNLITKTFSDVDLAILIQSDLELSDYKSLKKAAQLALSGKVRETNNALQNYVSAEHNVPDTVELIHARNLAADKLRSGNFDDSIDTVNEALKPLMRGATFSASQDLQLMSDVITRSPQENMEVMGFVYPVSSAILSTEISGFLRASSDDSNLPVENPEIRRKVFQNRLRLWDTGIDWSTNANAENDIRVIATGYAVLKRLSILTSSLQSSLEEISYLPQENQTAAREKSLENFWNLYHDTNAFITKELSAVISQNLDKNSRGGDHTANVLAIFANEDMPEAVGSTVLAMIERGELSVSTETYNLIREFKSGSKSLIDISQYGEVNYGANWNQIRSTSLALKEIGVPYQMILNNISKITPANQNELYSGMSGAEAPNNNLDIFNRTATAISGVFDNLEQTLTRADAGPKDVTRTLKQFLKINEGHPEFDKLSRWATSFDTRFAVLGVSRYNRSIE